MPHFLTTTFLAAACILWSITRFLFRKSPLDNVRGPPSQSIWTGNFESLFDTNGWKFHAYIAQTYGKVARIEGPMRSQLLYVFDPLALHHIIVKDQPIYSRNTSDLLVSKIMFGEGLLSIGSGEQHQRQRKLLNPAFSNVHLRQLGVKHAQTEGQQLWLTTLSAPVFYDVAHKLRAGLASKVNDSPAEIDILHSLKRCALELIGRGGLGYSFDNLEDDNQPVHPYSEAISGIQPLLIRLSLAFRLILPWASKIGSPHFQRAIVDWVPWEALHQFRDTVDIMDLTTREIFETKKRALSTTGEWSETHNSKDIISILMQTNARAGDNDRLSDTEILGQMTTFIFAATETTATALAQILYLLAQNPDVQDRLRAELSEAQQRDAGDINYDHLMQLPYLDAVCRETLRLHPPTPFSMRTSGLSFSPRCSAHNNYPALSRTPFFPSRRQFKGAMEQISEPCASHAARTSCFPSKMRIATQVFGGADATEWKPSRWLAPLPETVTNAPATGVYQHLFTFSGGPRGMHVMWYLSGLWLATEVVLAVLLPAFHLSLGERHVDWNLGFIVQPSVEGKEQLPLVFSML
ncbi:putative cytochrome P450 4d20 [Mycena sanguinolenta]|uniref:Putative cytochrome P450 4d20 n=1 Tax=Mycena sanguinolenta TaxID=230812 RepID=A0A8H7D3C7_9AGAR|nr:putative cytochrome P450 4d20 [Mycena sanguinolenta]